MTKIKRETLIVIAVLSAFILWVTYSLMKFEKDVIETVMSQPATSYQCEDLYDGRGHHVVHSDGGVYSIDNHTFIFLVNGKSVGNVGPCKKI